MSKWGAALAGALVGGAVAFVYGYLFGPAPGTSYTSGYRSRLDDALEQGQLAAAEKEQALRSRYVQIRSTGVSTTPPSAPTPPAPE
jgi:gas vesicle protein